MHANFTRRRHYKASRTTMQHADSILKDFGVDHECEVVSAHRTPKWMLEFAESAEKRGIK